MSNINILKRLYNNYTKDFVPKILLSVLFSLIVAASTASIAWLLDPAIKKLFIEKDQSLIIFIPLMIIVAFTVKGTSLYLAKTTMIKVGESVKKKLQNDMVNTLIETDTQTIDRKHSGKFISNLTPTNPIFTVLLFNGFHSKYHFPWLTAWVPNILLSPLLEPLITNPPSSDTAFYGYAIDGYISGANIFIDQNFNFKQDDGEFTAVTATDGSFTIETNSLWGVPEATTQ